MDFSERILKRTNVPEFSFIPSSNFDLLINLSEFSHFFYFIILRLDLTLSQQMTFR